jgi:phosphoesterase RecJ-like protein
LNDYLSNIDKGRAIELMRCAKRVIITTHLKPDGDAFGSLVALATTLKYLGAEVYTYYTGPLHISFTQLNGAELVTPFDASRDWPQADLVIIADTGAWSQVGAMGEHLKARLDKTLIVDHHISGDIDAKWKYIDGDAAACCEVLADLIEPLGGAFDRVVAESLFVGIASDTGWFKFSNTRPQTLELAARLLRMGVDHAEIYRRTEQTERVEKLKLMIRALDSLQLVAGDRAAIMVLRAGDFAETGALLEETERFVDLPQVVAKVEVVVLITEPPADQVRLPNLIGLSFRSKPGPAAVNVANLAQQFGGGGHARAAGAKVDAPLDDVIARVRGALGQWMGG